MVEVLSSAEFKVFALVAKGRTNREAAEELHVKLGTVKGHLQSVYKKLGAKSAAHAVAIAFYEGIFQLPRAAQQSTTVHAHIQNVSVPDMTELLRSWINSGRARNLRRAANITQEQAARDIGCTVDTLRGWERGRLPYVNTIPVYYRWLAAIAVKFPASK